MSEEVNGYNLSFAGCGFLGLYHAGVCECIQEFAPQLYINNRISGASAGSIAAAFLITDANISDCIKFLSRIINDCRQYTLGAFDPRFRLTQLLIDGLERYLPDDVHIRCSGRLHISMSNNITHENFIATHYRNKDELIRAIVCSSFIHVFSGYTPYTFRGLQMVDGGLTKNILELDENTITVSPFAGDADICPKDDWGYGQLHFLGTSFLMNWDNFSRILGILKPRSPDGIIDLARQGYDDALKFLARKGFIKCDLHRFGSSLRKLAIDREIPHALDDCKTCRRHLQLALDSTLSESTIQSFEKPEEKSSWRTYIFKQLIQSFYSVTKVSVQPISTTINAINQSVYYLKHMPNFVVGSLSSPINRLIYLDRMLQQVVGNAMEFGADNKNKDDHLRIHEALRRIQHRIVFHDNFPSSRINSLTSIMNDYDDDKSTVSHTSEDNESCGLSPHRHHQLKLDDQPDDLINLKILRKVIESERGEADGLSDKDDKYEEQTCKSANSNDDQNRSLIMTIDHDIKPLSYCGDGNNNNNDNNTKNDSINS